jgi:hypothetical protein
MKPRVGIFTYHSSYNFGANLQALAMQMAFEKYGAEATVINYRDARKDNVYLDITSQAQSSEHEKFIESYLNLSPEIRSISDLSEYCANSFDAIVVGSDAVFRLPPAWSLVRLVRKLMGRVPRALNISNRHDLPAYWLDWDDSKNRKKVRKYAVSASSAGTLFLQLYPSLYPKIRRALKDFDGIWVRDRWTQRMVSLLSLGSCKAQFSPDPVFALSKLFKVPDNERCNVNLDNTILLSGAFEQDWARRFVDAAHNAGYRVANLPNPDNDFLIECADIQLSTPMSPLAWYDLLSSATGYIGIRYHAMISSLSTGTPVVSIDNPGRLNFAYKMRSRAADVAVRAGIEERIVSMSKLQKIEPSVLIDSLFEGTSKRKADLYAEAAATEYLAAVEEVMNALSKEIK